MDRINKLIKLKNEFISVKCDWNSFKTLLDKTEKTIDYYEENKKIFQKYKDFEFVKNTEYYIIDLKLSINKLYIKSENIKIEMKKIEDDIIKNKNKNSKLETNFRFFNEMTGYDFMRFNILTDWKLIEEIYKKYEKKFVENAININIKIFSCNSYKHSKDELKEWFEFNTKKEIISEIEFLLNSIKINNFFNFIVIMNGEFVIFNKKLHTLPKHVPEYFYNNIVYNGNVSLKINEKIFKFKDPTLNNIVEFLPIDGYFKIEVIQ